MALAACRADAPPPPDSAPPPAPAPEAAWTVSAAGYGPIRVGSTIAELNAALNESVRPAYQAGEECDYVHPARLPGRVNLMVVKDTVVRIDVDTTGVLTEQGAGWETANSGFRSCTAGSRSSFISTGPKGAT
jgi:hypothetical protein